MKRSNAECRLSNKKTFQTANVCFCNCKLLGRGSHGTIFRGHKIDDMDELVAVKVLHENVKEEIANNEITTLLKLKESQHDNIVRMLAFNKMQRKISITMEYCDGGDILELLYFDKNTPLKLIQSISYQMSKALYHLKLLGIIHLDIKPDNIFVCKGNKTESWDFTFKLGDFSKSKVMIGEKKVFTDPGTKYFVAPEVLERQPVDCKTNVWSMGATLVSLMLKRFIFDGTLTSIKDIVPKINISNVHIDLHDLILGLLVIDQDKRIAESEYVSHSFHEIFIDSNQYVQYNDQSPYQPSLFIKL